MKILEKVMYLLYIASIAICGYQAFVENSSDNLMMCIWIFNAMIMFTLYRSADKMYDEQQEWVNKMISELLENKINTEISRVEGEKDNDKNNM